MEELITFLTSNIQFLIVIIGIVYFLFFRKSPLEKRTQNRMPDFGGESRRPTERPVRPVPAQTRPERYEPVETTYSAPETFYDPGPAALSDPAPASRVSRSAAAAGSHQPDSYVYESSREAARGPSRQDLARAVLWSEILGRPRARKPYRR
ncbi:hypothetical protein [Cohnella hongkongensis]|uniref:Uncharacterized protein n=1 Tax=Cohnella hongkongensis TaxID=178337 RepID=A0ABV9FF20_9BACL